MISSERLIGAARLLALSLVAGLVVLFPVVQVQPAMAAIDTSRLNFNNQVCDLTAAGYEGTGAEEDPYKISDSDALWEVTDCSLTGSAAAHFEITNDIDVRQAESASTASPVGYSTSGDVSSFSGVLDGGNKVISGISMSTTSYGVGLFAYLHNATVRNLVISGSFVTTTNTETVQDSAGALAIWANGSLDLSSISNQASVSGKKYVAGLVGRVVADVNIDSSHNAGAVSGSNYVGGLVGYVEEDANITSSFNDGTISGTANYVGGLVGYVSVSANITSSYNTGAISGIFDVGGLVGNLDGNGRIDSSYNTGAVSGSQDVGGLVGQLDGNASIDSSYNTGAVSGSSYVGGLAGFVLDHANITSSYNTATVSGAADYVGGLVGRVNANANITSSYNTGPVSGDAAVSGLVGYVVADANITSSYNTGSVSGTFDVAGLVGSVNNNANINSSFNDGTVSGFRRVGGLVGRVQANANITSSFNDGTVSGFDIEEVFIWDSRSEFVGGLLGFVDSEANISASHNSSAVSGAGIHVGGLLGGSNGDANINFSYNTGTVSGSNQVGGLVGYLSVDANITSSYNTGTISGTANNVGGLLGLSQTGDANINFSYNTGTVSGSNRVGGLVGLVDNGNASIASSYNTGPASGASNVDGLVGAVSTITTTTAYTSVTSDHVATSTVADMKKASTYVGFNFTNTWGFGACTDNEGFPMLRVFAEISNYNSVACGYTPPQSQQPSPAPVPVLQPLPEIDQTRIQTAAGTKQLLTGKRFELIRSASINGLPATISQLTATSFVLSIPALGAGNYSLELDTSNGRISFQGLVDVVESSLGSAQLGPTFSVITGLNPRSSWLNKTALAELEEIFKGQSVVTCISYHDRPGVITRKKALSRAMHACRVADQLGIETKVFVYGKAPELADTVKILFR